MFNKGRKNIFNESGFTLVEVAIVMLIFSTIIIGLIGGRRMIVNAKIVSVISEINSYKTGFNSFYYKFNQYPGDFANASSSLIDIRGNEVENGNGDELIGDSDFTNNESTGFFHHLFLSKVIDSPEFTGESVSRLSDVRFNENYPGTKFQEKTFYFVASDNIFNRYKRQNRIVIASTKGLNGNALKPVDAKSIDIKIDDDNPFRGTVVSNNINIINGVSEDDGGCTNINGYDEDSEEIGCVVQVSLSDTNHTLIGEFSEQNPNFGDKDEERCMVPISGSVGFENIEYWIDANTTDVVLDESTVLVPTQIQAICEVGYRNTPEMTCIADETWTSLSRPCVLDNCSSGQCLNHPTFFCGDNWDCTDHYCCDDNLVYGQDDILESNIIGDCYDNCIDSTLGNDSINGGSTANELYGDCYTNCSGTTGNDSVDGNNGNDTIYGDCNTNCNGNLGNDTLIGGSGDDIIYGDCRDYCSSSLGNDNLSGGAGNDSLYGDCNNNCVGTMGNDSLTGGNGADYLVGDCVNQCADITNWATDTFIVNDLNDSYGTSLDQIVDFNAGEIDDKLRLPGGASNVTIISDGPTGRRVTYTVDGDLGEIIVQCNRNHNECGAWGLKACNIYIGSSQLPDSGCVGCDVGGCSFN